ncbi:hypothetical protein [Candidatus Solirubrobacter pratensis]|uniref:hypothetical protein n=1 Tax=Candidatus Solirubrobacter pratensis TaxID=1298857 RepID=UPI0003F768A6|nr:hypothetical protein [Candidatus Solirubrobacter pratensis]
MATFAAWVLLPFALLVGAGGTGLLAETVSGAHLPNGLIVPVGTCVLVLLGLPFYLLGAGAPAPALLFVVVTAAGYIAARANPLRPVTTPAALAALLVYLLYLAPVLLTGHWTWTGYNFVNDPSVNMLMTDHIAHSGDSAVSGPLSTAHAVIKGTLGVSYPLGVHSLLATFDWLVPVTLPAAYQPYIAFLAGTAAMAFTELGRACKLPAWAAVGAAVLALGAGLTYNYGLQGAFKEIAVVACIATAAGLARVALDARLHAGTVSLIAISLAAAIAIISAVAAGYAAALALVLLITSFAGERRPDTRTIARAALVGGCVLLVAMAPFLKETIVFGQAAGDQYGSGTTNSPSVLGQLLRPLPLTQSLGIWLRDDYRYPLEPGPLKTLTVVLLIVAAALIITGIASEVHSRRWGATLALVPTLAVALATASLLSPYGQAKMLVILSPMAVFTAAVGAWWLIRRFRPAGWVAAAVLAAGVLGTDAMAYHYTQIAPTGRLEALDDALHHTGSGTWMLSEWEEYAKFIGRDIDLDVGPEGYVTYPQLRSPGAIFNRSFDVDEVTLGYLEHFGGLVVRRSPVASRPPLNFSKIYENAYYELWRRDPRRPAVLEHLPLGSAGALGGRPSCEAVTAIARRTRGRQRLVAAMAPAAPTLDVPSPRYTPRGWGRAPVPDALIPGSEGLIRAELPFSGGRYEAWIRGSAERPLTVSVDGRVVGRASGVNTPGQFLPAGTVTLTPGRHTVVLRRPGGGLAPGDGNPGIIGRLVFQPVPAEPRLVTVDAHDARRLCGRAWDWIERVQ